jgi:four helix bundle protein
MAEACAKRAYPKHFQAKLTDSAGENFETQVWLDFALDAGYLTSEEHAKRTNKSESVRKLLSYMQIHAEQFL